jgi:hypothetical protein
MSCATPGHAVTPFSHVQWKPRTAYRVPLEASARGLSGAEGVCLVAMVQRKKQTFGGFEDPSSRRSNDVFLRPNRGLRDLVLCFPD